MNQSTRSLLHFAVSSLVAIAAGCFAMAQSGVTASAWLRTVAAWFVGALLAAAIVRFGKSRAAAGGALLIGVAGIVATLFAPAADGVHRWIDIGPLHINAAALLLPATIVALRKPRITSLTGIATAVIAASVLLHNPMRRNSPHSPSLYRS